MFLLPHRRLGLLVSKAGRFTLFQITEYVGMHIQTNSSMVVTLSTINDPTFTRHVNTVSIVHCVHDGNFTEITS